MGPARFHCATLLSVREYGPLLILVALSDAISKEQGKNYLSEVGFEPTPTEVDCDLNAAP